METNFTKGMLVEGEVVTILDGNVYIDIGEKQEAIVPLSEFNEEPQPGSRYSFVYLKRKKDGFTILSKREADIRKGWESIKEAYQNGYPMTGKIIEEIPGKGYTMRVEEVNLFLPASHLVSRFKDINEMKKKELDVKIIEINDKKRTAVVSQKKLIEEINNEKWDQLLEKVKIGDRVIGKVVKIVNFGVFCDVHGIIGLLRQNDISYKKYAPFKHKFKVGKEVELVVLDMDKSANRLSLGMKQLFEDPWEWARRELESGVVVRGVVTSVTKFGIFLEIIEGLEGLIHVSELSWSKKPVNPKDLVKKGQELEAEVKDLDVDNKRLSLSLKSLQPDPWQNLSSEVRVGNVLEGAITGITKYGAFVEVENGIEGLIHSSDITWDDRINNPVSLLKKGQKVKYKILDINIDERRISCGLKQLTEHPYEALRKKYPPQSILEGKVKSIVDFGIFLEIEPGFEGLVHKSEIPENAQANLKESYPIGSTVKVAVLRIDPSSKKISLSIKGYEKAQEKMEISKYIKKEGEISKESLGAFINIK